MSGTIPLSMTQQFDVYGKPLAGGQLYIIQAGTVSTPQDAFQDTALTIKQPYPMTLDAAGRVPQFFVADGFVKVRLQDKAGVVQLASDSVMVIGLSSGGGGGSTVDPSQLIKTGSMLLRYGFGVLDGYVRMNGNTIGNSTSAASELHSDTLAQALYLYLYGADPNLVVSGGRTGNAANDFGNSKPLALPDWRGCAPYGMDDMGAARANNLTKAYWGNGINEPNVLGNFGGLERITLDATMIPIHTHANTLNDLKHRHNLIGSATNSMQAIAFAIPGGFGTPPGSVSYRQIDTISSGISTDDQLSGITINNASTGGGQAHRTVGPGRVCTFYLKL